MVQIHMQNHRHQQSKAWTQLLLLLSQATTKAEVPANRTRRAAEEPPKPKVLIISCRLEERNTSIAMFS